MPDPLIKRLEYLSGGDKSFQKELVELFLSESAKNIDIVDREISAQNLTDAARAVHAIKGAALNVGAQKLSQVSETLEVRLESGIYEPTEVQALKDEFFHINQKLKSFLASL